MERKKPKKTPASVSAQTGAKKKTQQRHDDTTTTARAQGGEATAGKAKEIPHGRLPRTFWKDPRMRELQREHRELLIYLYESDQAYSEGLYRLSVGEAAEDLGLTLDEVRAGITTLTERGFVAFDARHGVICLLEAMGIQLPRSDNEAKGWAQRVVRLREASVFPVFRKRLDYYLKRAVHGPAHQLPMYIEQVLQALDGQMERPSDARRTGVERPSNERRTPRSSSTNLFNEPLPLPRTTSMKKKREGGEGSVRGGKRERASGDALPSPAFDSQVKMEERNQKRPVPEDFEPSAMAKARAKRLGMNPGGLVAAFKDVHRAKGSERTDWDKAFLAFIRSEEKFNGRR
jgi:hypothetical protein